MSEPIIATILYRIDFLLSYCVIIILKRILISLSSAIYLICNSRWTYIRLYVDDIDNTICIQIYVETRTHYIYFSIYSLLLNINEYMYTINRILLMVEDNDTSK